MGQPGKYGLCFAEGNDDWFPGLHTRRGLDPCESAVTVIGVSGTMEVVPTGGDPRPEPILAAVQNALTLSTRMAAGTQKDHSGEDFLLLPGELAKELATTGWTLEGVQGALTQRPTSDPQDIDLNPSVGATEGAFSEHATKGFRELVTSRRLRMIVTGGAGIKMTFLPTWAGGTVAQTRGLLKL
jgi:hypothetical protein